MSTIYLTKSPLRVSFFGGGTDFPSWFNQNMGYTLSTTIDYFSYVYYNTNIFPKDPNYNIYSRELERTNNIKDIKNPLIKKLLAINSIRKCKIFFDTDMPSRSGLASSTSFAHSLSLAINKSKKLSLSKRDFSKYLIDLERNLLKERGGWQDQIVISYQDLIFTKYYNNDFKVSKVSLHKRTQNILEKNLFLLWTGIQRFSSDVQLELIKKIEKKRDNNHIYLSEIASIAKTSKNLFSKNNFKIEEFSSLLNESSKLKMMSNVNSYSKYILEIIEFCKSNGCKATKVLGAGSGGFILILIDENQKKNIAKISSKFKVYPFKFYFSNA